jgi:acyl-CoA reductase-like NAD-dependent aldehyde dehydrogenase
MPVARAERAHGIDTCLISTDASGGTVYYQRAGATGKDAGRATEMAQLAFECWRRAPGLARSRALVRASERVVARSRKIADDIVRETGKPVAQAETAVARAANVLFHYAAIAAGRR